MLARLDRLGLANGEDGSLANTGNISPGKNLLQIDLFAGLGEEVARTKHGKEVEESNHLDCSECLVLFCRMRICGVCGKDKLEDFGGDGKGAVDGTLGSTAGTTHDHVKGAIGLGGWTVEADPAVECKHHGEVLLEAAGGLDPARG